MKHITHINTRLALLLGAALSLFCGEEPYNPLDPNDSRYQKTTIDIISDNAFSGDDTITITTDEALELGDREQLS